MDIATDNRTGTDDERKYETLPLEVLWEIFGWRNTLSPGDLLSCRAVCKTWRDGATSFLLNQNSLAVVLRFRVDEEEDATYSSTLINNAPHSTSSLSDLTECISNSPSFPSTTICFHSDIDEENTWGNMIEWEPWEHQQNLLKFFLLHGPKMKRLGLRDWFPAKALQSILYEHMPHLECLDLKSFCEFFESKRDGTGEDTILRPDSQENIGLKEIILHDGLLEFELKLLKELLHISPKLIKIHNVNIEVLKLLLRMKKSHLIQSFYWRPIRNDFPFLEEFADLFKSPLPLLPCPHATRPVLSKLDFTFVEIFGKFPDHNLLILALNSILEGNKDTLKYLSFDTIPQEVPNAHPIKIPSMPKLVSLRLVELYEYETEEGAPVVVLEMNRNWKKGFNNCSAVTNYAPDMSATYSWNLFQFDGQGNDQDRSNIRKIPQNYFPRLRKLDLCVKRNIRSWQKLFGFFAMDRVEDFAQEAPSSVIAGDRIFSVTELEIPCFVLGSDQLSRMFPNISSLTITSPCKFRNSVWTMFPFLKRFEICESPKYDKKSFSAVDSFFTGIPEELCVRFLSEPTAGLSLSSAQVNKLFRTEPYIGSCQNLTEFKINFKGRLEANFASKVSAVYGFRELGPQTKCIFSFKSLGLSRKGVADMRRWLAPLRPNVHIET